MKEGINFLDKVGTPDSSTVVSSEELKKGIYEKFAKGLALIVRQISELPIPEKTIADWKVLMSSAYVVDHNIDHIPDPDKRILLMQKIFSFLKDEVVDFSDNKDLEKALQDIKNLSQGLTENQKQFFLNSLFRVLKITEMMKVEENPKNLVNLRRLEGQSYLKSFLPFLPEEFRQSDDYHKLVHVLTRLLRAGNTFDSLIDLPDDFKDKQIKIKPSLANRMLFLSYVFSDGLSGLKDIGLLKNMVLARKMLLGLKRIVDTN